MDPVTFTTEQELPFEFEITDGLGRPSQIDGEPVEVSSDETIGVVTVAKVADGKYAGKISAVTPSPVGTTQRVTITADADLGAGVQAVVGFVDFTVTMDPRSSVRMIKLTVGAPRDKTAAA